MALPDFLFQEEIMEQTSNQKANTIVIDDGSKEYNIQNQHGETLAVLSLIHI